MPDTTTPRIPILYRRSNLLLVLAAISATFMLFSPHLISAQDGGDSGSCPGAQPIETFTGSGNQTTPRFETTGESFRISYSSTPTSEDPSLASLGILVNGADEDFFTPVTDEGGGDGESFVNAGPGMYSLDILAANLEYEIVVEDCTGGAPVGGGGGGTDGVGDPGGEPGASDAQYENGGEESITTPRTGGPPLSILAAALLWTGVGGILLTRRFA